MTDVDFSKINIDKFRVPGLTFIDNYKKTGREFYIDAPRGSLEWKLYWDEQEYYCKYGFSVDGIRITGDHYFYLNFCMIMITTAGKAAEAIVKKKSADTKILTFPEFWDADYYYYHEIEKARADGQHLLVLKPRRRGYSYKNAALAAKKYTFERNATVLILGYDLTFAQETMKMAVDYLDFLIRCTDFGKSRDYADKPKEIVEASFTETMPDGRKVKGGYMSRIMCATSKNNPDVARGKGASLVLFEEAGSFDNLKATYMATKPTVESGQFVTGQMILFGTGGDMTGGMVDFEDMFYNPEPYGLRPYANIYEDGMENTQIGFFLPDYYCKDGFIINGVSQATEARQYEEAERDRIRRTSKDPSLIDKRLVEYPQTPREALTKISSNIFPKGELQAQLNKLKSGKAGYLGVPGLLLRNSDGLVTFEHSGDERPIMNFPVKRDQDTRGCVVQYQGPYRVNGGVPSNLYYICHDPYAFDETQGESIGATFVIKRMNNESAPDDYIVAEYVGRPATQDEYNRNLFLLAEYYNAKIGFENDRGNVIEFAKNNRLLHWLEEEFDVYDKNNKIANKLGRKFGMSMSNLERKRQGCIYLRDWLLRERGRDSTDKPTYNLNMINSIPLLEELIKYEYDGNFDRVSALLVGMYYEKQLLTTPVLKREYAYDDPFFQLIGEPDFTSGNY
jgi:hypothetical protein